MELMSAWYMYIIIIILCVCVVGGGGFPFDFVCVVTFPVCQAAIKLL